MIYIIGVAVFIVVFLVTLLGILFVQSAKSKSISDEQYSVNQNVLERLKEKQFEISRVFYVNDSYTYGKEKDYKKMIIVDSTNKKICFIDYVLKNYYNIAFDEFLDYELYENGTMMTSGAVVGGLGVGIFGAETGGNCKDLKLIIRIKNLTTPHIAYEIISNYMLGMGVSKNSALYRECMSALQEVISFFEVVKNENAKANSLQTCD